MPAADDQERPLPDLLFELALRAGEWIRKNEDVIRSVAVWMGVRRACEATRLYAPPSPAWTEISDAVQAGAGTEAIESVILAAYAPGGVGHEALASELRAAPLLQTRAQEIDDVLASFSDGRFYLTICGTLPLVEGLLADAYGKWAKRITDYPIEARLDEVGALTTEEEAELLINESAVTMVTTGMPEVWKSLRMTAGAHADELNRHWALHGSARGWNTVENATRAVLLLAAAARIAEPLLAPR
jgi:hypothetical protein